MYKAMLTFLLLAISEASIFCQSLKNNDSAVFKIPEVQTATTQGISSYIKNNFTSDSDRIRAVFVWVAHHINYDVQRLLTIKNQTEKQSIESVLKTRSAVCQGYADLFNELCNQ